MVTDSGEIAQGVPVELCFGRSWSQCGNLSYARLLFLPRVGEEVELPNRTLPMVYRVAEVRHVPATPGGAGPRVRVRLQMDDEAVPQAPGA
jgi:hypothetical protein